MSDAPDFTKAVAARRNKIIGAILLIALAIIAIVFEIRSGRSSPPVITKAFFSTDDGATYFADDKSKMSGFVQNGKTAYRTYVFRCAGGTEFVGFLERFSSAAVKQIEAIRAREGSAAASIAAASLSATNSEVKRPGDANWVKRTDAAASSIVHAIKCPDGNTTDLEPVEPP